MVLKQKPIRSERHRRFVASLPCCVSGMVGMTQAAHIRYQTNAGLGLKSSDSYCLPLSVYEHNLQHNMGSEPKYWARHGGIDKAKSLANNLFLHTGNEQKALELIMEFRNA